MTKGQLNHKKKIGFILMIIIVFCWIAVPILPFFDFPRKTIIITILFLTGEILFIIAIALLGKEYYNKFKNKIYQFFSFKKKGNDRISELEKSNKIDTDGNKE